MVCKLGCAVEESTTARSIVMMGPVVMKQMRCDQPVCAVEVTPWGKHDVLYSELDPWHHTATVCKLQISEANIKINAIVVQWVYIVLSTQHIMIDTTPCWQTSCKTHVVQPHNRQWMCICPHKYSTTHMEHFESIYESENHYFSILLITFQYF